MYKADKEPQSLSEYFRMLANIFASAVKPAFGIDSYRSGGRQIAVTEDILVDKPFGSLLHFRRDTSRKDPKILILSPMSGHYATILRETIRDLIPFHDVYVTDWKNACDVPLKEGDFSLSDYVSYVQEFIDMLGAGTHMMGISQSTVPLLAVAALRSSSPNSVKPASIILMAGPIDPRVAETETSLFAKRHSLSRIRQTMMRNVAFPERGMGRLVLPGSLTRMMMVMNGHTDPESLATMDLNGTYYLDTIRHVFQEYSLPSGTMTWQGQAADLKKIVDIPMITIEGGLDKITAVGQTAAAHDLCVNLPARLKFHYCEPTAGHYDIFQGSAWQKNVMPRLAWFTRNADLRHGKVYDPMPAVKLKQLKSLCDIQHQGAECSEQNAYDWTCKQKMAFTGKQPCRVR